MNAETVLWLKRIALQLRRIADVMVTETKVKFEIRDLLKKVAEEPNPTFSAPDHLTPEYIEELQEKFGGKIPVAPEQTDPE